MAKDKGHLPGIILAGTRIWIFGESVLAAIGTYLSGCQAALKLGTISRLLASTSWDRKVLFLFRASQEFTERLGERCYLKPFTGTYIF